MDGWVGRKPGMAPLLQVWASGQRMVSPASAFIHLPIHSPIIQHTPIHTLTHTYTHTHTHPHRHTLTHTYTHTHIHPHRHTLTHTLLTYLPSPGSQELGIKLLNRIDQQCLSPQSQHSSKI